MTPEDLTAIEQRASAATPGPWRLDHGDVIADEPGVGAVGIAEVIGVRDTADAVFIAKAREDVPALLAEVRRLQEYEQRAFAQEAQLSKAAGELVAMERQLDAARVESAERETTVGFGAAEWMARAEYAEGMRKRAEAKLARVEALPARLRGACKSRSYEGLEVQGWLDNAAEWIEEALKATEPDDE